MPAPLPDVIRYLCFHYPHSAELSKARVTKMVYLCDWVSAVWYAEPVTNINWIFNHYGPYVDDIVNSAQADTAYLRVWKTVNLFGNPKEMILPVPNASPPESLDKRSHAVCDFVINTTKSLYWNAFLELVYSTQPVKEGARLEALDILGAAERYRAAHHIALPAPATAAHPPPAPRARGGDN